MKIKMTCKVHPTSDVYVLDGTVKFQTSDGNYTTEDSERATAVEIDEKNLYCSGDNPYGQHDFFLMYTNGGEDD